MAKIWCLEFLAMLAWSLSSPPLLSLMSAGSFVQRLRSVSLQLGPLFGDFWD